MPFNWALLLMQKVVKNRIIRVRNKTPQQLWSIVLVSFSVFLIVLGGLGLLYVQQPLREETFDTRRDASVAQGYVDITSTYTPHSATNPKGTLHLKFNSHERQVSEMNLVFNIITQAISLDAQDIPEIHTNFTGSTLSITDLEVEGTNDGYLVSMTLKPRYGTTVATTSDTTFAVIEVTPKRTGDITLSFDRETSHALVPSANGPQDQLEHVPNQVHTVTVANNSTNVLDDSLYFVESRMHTRFYKTDGTEISTNNMQLGQNYRGVITFQVQNSLKNITLDPAKNSQVQVILATQGRNRASKEYAYSVLSGSRDGFGDSMEFDFTRTSDELLVGLTLNIKENTPDTATTNRAVTTLKNRWSRVYYLGGTGGTSLKSCNESCSNNVECPANHRCYQNRCRLVTNLSSSSCSAPPDNGLQRTCNQYCADTRECAEGYTCHYNRCRRPDNVESTVCALPSAALQQAIKDSCNDSCKSNAECANNMRCFMGACRLATNPSSTTCTATTQPSVSTRYYSSTGGPSKGAPSVADRTPATPSATTRPATGSATRPATMSAQPATTAAGLVSPRPTPSPSPQGEAVERVTPAPVPSPATSGNFFQRLTQGGISFPIIALVIGLLLLIIVGVMAVVNLLKGRSSSAPGGTSVKKKTAYEDELQQRIKTLREQQGQAPAPNVGSITPPPPSLTKSEPSVPTTQAPTAPAPAPQSTPIEPDAPTEITPPPSTLRTQGTPAAQMSQQPPTTPISGQTPPVAQPAQPSQPTPAAPAQPPTHQSTSMMERIRMKGINPPEKDSQKGQE
jgi:hypothetical protein